MAQTVVGKPSGLPSLPVSVALVNNEPSAYMEEVLGQPLPDEVTTAVHESGIASGQTGPDDGAESDGSVIPPEEVDEDWE